MGQRELLLLLGAITIFGAAALNLKRFTVDQNESMLERQFEVYAVALAQSFLEEASVKAFDANGTNASSPEEDDFTDPAALGPEAGETYPAFNDVDDFDGFAKTDSSALGTFRVTVQVGYVQEANPNLVVNTRTFCKKMTVTVTQNFLPRPINLSQVFGYKNN